VVDKTFPRHRLAIAAHLARLSFGLALDRMSIRSAAHWAGSSSMAAFHGALSLRRLRLNVHDHNVDGSPGPPIA